MWLASVWFWNGYAASIQKPTRASHKDWALLLIQALSDTGNRMWQSRCGIWTFVWTRLHQLSSTSSAVLNFINCPRLQTFHCRVYGLEAFFSTCAIFTPQMKFVFSNNELDQFFMYFKHKKETNKPSSKQIEIMRLIYLWLCFIKVDRTNTQKVLFASQMIKLADCKTKLFQMT